MSEVKAVTLADKLALAEQLKIPARKAVEKSHEMDKGIVGQYNGDFPLSTATINNVYYFPNNRKYYRCIADYNGVELTQPNTENFKELSFLELEKSVDGAMPLIQADIKKYNDNVTAKKQELSTTAEQEKAKVTAEGGKQVGLVNSEATKVTEQLRSLVEGNPETSNALSLSGKSRLEFEKETQGVAGGYAGKFPLTSAVKDGIYLLPETGKFYVCNQEFKDKSLIVPDSTFEELSVWKNKSKLDNLTEVFETYDNPNAACLSGEPYNTVQINGKTKYIGFTKDLDAKKASMIHYKIDGEEYALRRYCETQNMSNFASKTYSSTYTTMTELPADFPDTSDAILANSLLNGCKMLNQTLSFDLRNATTIAYAFYNCNNLKLDKIIVSEKLNNLEAAFSNSSIDKNPLFFINNAKKNISLTSLFEFTKIKQCTDLNIKEVVSLWSTFNECKELEIIDNLDTTYCKDFRYMLQGTKLKQICPISLKALTAEDINTKLEGMLKSITTQFTINFIDVPQGITVEQMRTATRAPLTCEIILNYRSQ